MDPIGCMNYETFVSLIHDSITIAGGKVNKETKFFSRPPTYWWNDECSTLAAQKRELFKTFKKAPSLCNLNSLKSFTLHYKKRLKQIKKNLFEAFCSSLSPFTDITQVWNTFWAFQGKSTVNQRTEAASTKMNEAALAAFDKAVPPFSVPCLSKDLPNTSLSILSASVRATCATSNNEFLLKPFTAEELNLAIRSIKVKSASGPDLISNKILANLPEIGQVVLLRIFNHIFNFGAFPAEWKQYYMCFLPKPGKKHEMRPISLANNLAKLFEKLIQYRFEWWIENNKLLSNFQYGFRRSSSCTDNLVYFTGCILRAFAERQHLGAVFIDIKGAFDNVDPNKLTNILVQCGVPPKIMRFLKHMIDCRLVEGFYNGNSMGTRTATREVPPDPRIRT